MKVEEDSEGFSAVSYAKANVLLAEAIKELTQEMRNEIFELKTQLDKTKLNTIKRNKIEYKKGSTYPLEQQNGI